MTWKRLARCDRSGDRLLLDKLAVQEALDRYWFGLGRGDVDAVVSSFTADARYGGATGEAEIRAVVQQISSLRCINILRGSQLITIDGDDAQADTQAVAFVVVPGPAGDRLMVQGLRYVDRLRRTRSGWLVADRSGLAARLAAHDIHFEYELLTASTRLSELMEDGHRAD